MYSTKCPWPVRNCILWNTPDERNDGDEGKHGGSGVAEVGGMRNVALSTTRGGMVMRKVSPTWFLRSRVNRALKNRGEPFAFSSTTTALDL